MAQISRLKNAEIANGNLIDADDINVELDQLLSESNTQDSRLSAVESADVILSGVKTFTSAPKADEIKERSTDAGVTIDGVLLKDGRIKLDGAPTEEGQLGYIPEDEGEPARLLAYLDGTEQELYHTGNLMSDLPVGHINGPCPVLKDASAWTIKSGLRLRDTSDSVDIVFDADVDVALSVSGAGGLDTGSEAADTHYYLIAITDSTSVEPASGIWSATRPKDFDGSTLPAGYDTWRWTGVSVRNDDSSDIIPSYVHDGWPYKPRLRYSIPFPRNGNSDTNVFQGSTNNIWTAFSVAAFTPLEAETVGLVYHNNNSSHNYSLRPKGSTDEQVGGHNSTSGEWKYMEAIPDANQEFETGSSSASASYRWSVRDYIIDRGGL